MTLRSQQKAQKEYIIQSIEYSGIYSSNSPTAVRGKKREREQSGRADRAILLNAPRETEEQTKWHRAPALTYKGADNG
jgi:hypothetical protein